MKRTMMLMLILILMLVLMLMLRLTVGMRPDLQQRRSGSEGPMYWMLKVIGRLTRCLGLQEHWSSIARPFEGVGGVVNE